MVMKHLCFFEWNVFLYNVSVLFERVSVQLMVVAVCDRMTRPTVFVRSKLHKRKTTTLCDIDAVWTSVVHLCHKPLHPET